MGSIPTPGTTISILNPARFGLVASAQPLELTAVLTATWVEVRDCSQTVLGPGTRAELDRAIEGLKEAHSHPHQGAGDFELPALKHDEVRQNLQFIRHFAER